MIRQFVLSLLPALLLGPAAIAQTPPAPAVEPAPGVFLVAARDMPDPRFQESVILLLEHDDDGTLGLIVNRRTEIPLAEALPDFTDSEQPLYWGGPVATHLALLLVRGERPPGQSEPVMDEVYWSIDPEALRALLDAGAGPGRLRVFLGHAGWAPGQLAAELAEDSWRLFEADPDRVFAADPESLWETFIRVPEQILARRR